MNRTTIRHRRAGLLWMLAGMLLSLCAHLAATRLAREAGLAMRGASEVASRAADVNVPFEAPYRAAAFAIVTIITAVYLWPLARFCLGDRRRATKSVQRRAISAPLVLSAVTLIPWLGSIAAFAGVTLARIGLWSEDMFSEQVITPALSGFIAATAQYLMLEWVFRERIVPLVFPEGGLGDVRRAFSLPVAARLVVLAIVIGFTPAFVMIGLVTAAADRVRSGMADAGIILALEHNAQWLFAFLMVTGAGYLAMFARSLTVPLAQLARAVAGIRRGELTVHVPVRTRDEIGALAQAVNELAGSLRERTHILRTFGRIVDPAVRDRLLAGELSPRGEVREVAMLFADVRAFTMLAEHRPPEEVVATLNELFGVMAAGVKQCGGSVDKFVGDAMLAVFGLFESAEAGDPAGGAAADKAAAAALDCALRLRGELARIAAVRARDGAEPVRVSIAVHAGPVVAATLGAEDRFDFTVVGDAVNVTSRLLDVAKERARELVVSAETVRRSARAGAVFETDWTGSAELRGRTAAIEVCTIAGA